MFFHRRLGGQKATETRHSQSRMRVGMAAGGEIQPLARLPARRRRLAVSRYGIIFGVKPDRGTGAVVPFRSESCRHAGRAFLDAESMASQRVYIPVLGLIFAPGRLAKIEDQRSPGGEVPLDFVDIGKGMGLCC